MVEYSDLVLVSDGRSLYKTTIGDVSSIVATHLMLEDLKKLSSTIDEIVSYLSSDKFLEKYYTKNQLSSTFIPLTTMQNLIANQTYVLTSDAVTAANSLSTESQISAWRNSQFVKNQNFIRDGYGFVKDAWNKAAGINWETEENQADRIKAFPSSRTENDSTWGKDLNGY